MVRADSDNGSTVALQASGRGSIPRRSTKELGLKVFMDAHNTVTVEEGDRYPLRPPSLSRSRKVVIRQAHNLKTAGAIPASATKYSLIAQLVEHLTVNQVVPGSSPGRGASFV